MQKIREVIEKRYEYWREKEFNSHSIESEIRMSECQHLLLMVDSVQEEPVNEELEDAATKSADKATPYTRVDIGNGEVCVYTKHTVIDRFKAGANWKKEQIIANTADAMIGLPYENKDGGYTHLIDVSRPLPVGNNKIAIIFKED